MVKIELLLKEFEKDLIAVIQSPRVFNRDTGEYEGGTPTEINFKGSILPLNSRDLNQLQVTAAGLYSVNDKKLYTEYPQTFLNDTVIEDGDKSYKVYVVRDYDIINPNFRLYYIKKIDQING